MGNDEVLTSPVIKSQLTDNFLMVSIALAHFDLCEVSMLTISKDKDSRNTNPLGSFWGLNKNNSKK